jgi:hypothetical protein
MFGLRMEEEQEPHTIFPGIRCPRCRSDELYLETGMYGGRVYHCKRCGYCGAFVIEGDESCIRADRASTLREAAGLQRSRTSLWVKIIAVLFILCLLFILLKGC